MTAANYSVFVFSPGFSDFSGVFLRRLKPSLSVMVGVGALLFVPGDLVAAELVAHRAVYDVSTEHVEGQTNAMSATGRVVLEFDGDACQGYTLNMRFLTRYQRQNGNSTTTDVQSTTWESGDGAEFRFNMRQYLDGNLTLSSGGDAVRGDGQGIAIDLDTPQEKQFEISQDVLFPTEHMALMIDQAEQGVRFLQRDVFDGSDTGDKVYATNAVMGRPSRSDIEGVSGAEPLNGMIYWPVSLAYFDKDMGGEQVPAYQLSFDLFRNGVSTDILIDYGDIVLRAKLVDIKFLDQDPCDD